MLEHLTIENYRSCLRTVIDFNPNLSVLIGPNGSGKTNILQAVMLLHKMATENRYARNGEELITGSSKISAAFRNGRSKVRVRAALDTRTDESNNDELRASKQKWTVNSTNGASARLDVPLSLARDGDIGRALHRRWRITGKRLDKPPEVPLWVARSLARVFEFCRGIKYYSASQFTNPSSCPVSFEIEGEGEGIRRPVRLRGHAKLLFDMYSASKSESAEQYSQFIDIVGRKGLHLIGDLAFREVPTSSIDHSVRVGGKVEIVRRRKLLVVPQFRIGRQRLSPNQLSEGTFKTLALLFHIITGESSALLIEEPEVCVHHGLLASILELIKSYSGQKQMILSTHSDYVLDHVSPENVFRVMLDKHSGTLAQYIPKTMSSMELAALREYLERDGNLGEYWREGGFGDRP